MVVCVPATGREDEALVPVEPVALVCALAGETVGACPVRAVLAPALVVVPLALEDAEPLDAVVGFVGGVEVALALPVPEEPPLGLVLIVIVVVVVLVETTGCGTRTCDAGAAGAGAAGATGSVGGVITAGVTVRAWLE